MTRPPGVVLRDVTEADIPVLFEHQADPEANEMAAFPAREWDAFVAHWGRIFRDETALTKAVVFDGRVAGNVLSFERDGERLVGYWIGKEYWGRGIATKALTVFLEHERTRPLHACVARHNVASIRVLEKCGFTATSEGTGADGIEEIVFELTTTSPAES